MSQAVKRDQKRRVTVHHLFGGPIAKDRPLFEITIFGERRDLTCVVGALTIIFQRGFCDLGGLTWLGGALWVVAAARSVHQMNRMLSSLCAGHDELGFTLI